MADQVDCEDESDSKMAVDVFTHSSTGFPGAWTEEEISALMDAWEQAVEIPRSPFARKPFEVAEKVIELLTDNGFRTVDRDEILKQMGTLRTEYRVYRGLVKIGILAVKGSCVPQLERILRKANSRKARRRRTSTASNQVDGVSEDDNMIKSEAQPESIDENTTRTKRVRFQRQTLQRSFRTVIAQQEALMEYLLTVFKVIEESSNKIAALLEELVAVHKTAGQTDLN